MQVKVRQGVRKYAERNGFSEDNGIWYKREGDCWVLYITIPREETPKQQSVEVVFWVKYKGVRYEKTLRLLAHLFLNDLDGALSATIRSVAFDVWSKVLFNE